MHITLMIFNNYWTLFILLFCSYQSFSQESSKSESYYVQKLEELLNNKEEVGFGKTLADLILINEEEFEHYTDTKLDYLFAIQDLSLNIGNRDNVFAYLEKAEKIIKKEEPGRYWEYFTNLANFYIETVDYTRAKENNLKALAELDRLRLVKERRFVLRDFAKNLMYLNEYDAAIQAAEDCIGICERVGDEKIKMNALSTIGSIYFKLQKYPKAADYFNQAYLYAKRNDHKKDLILYANKMANLYMALGQYQESIKYTKEGLKIADELNMYKYSSQCYLSIAKSEFLLNKFVDADNTLKRFMERKFVFKAIRLHCEVTILRAKIQWAKGDKERARVLYNIAENECIKDDLSSLMPEIFLGKAYYYYNENQFSPALQEIDNALRRSPEDLNVSLELMNLRSEVLEKQGAFKQAFYANKEKEIVFDSLVSMNKVGLVLTEQAKQEIEKGKFAIEKLETEKAELGIQVTQRRNIIFGLLFGILTLGISAYYYSRNRKLTIEKELAEVKQNLLRIQINPHFIFNTLNSIQSSFLLEDQEKTIHLFNKFSSLMRQVLENSEKAFIPLNEEMEMLINYLELEKVRTNNKFDYAINIGEGIDIYNEEIPSMILQIFIENSIWHGIIPKEERGLISIDVSKWNQKLSISVLDDGVGRAFSLNRKSNDQRKKKSLGTKLVSQRVNLLNRKFGKQLSLDILDGDNAKGTKVVLAI